MVKMEPLLILPILISFFTVIFLLPAWIRKAKKFGLVGRDMNKSRDVELAEGGGVTVIAGFILGILMYIALKTFYFKSSEDIIEIFSLLAVILMLSFIGMIDNLLGWRIGLGRSFRLIMCLFASIPLMVINAGRSIINAPLFGEMNLGWLYTLILVPLGITGASATFNTIAGFNGLEASQGIIILAGLSLVAYFTGSSWLAIIGLCMIFALIAFWIFNKYPAKVFPGDILTYPVGGLIAIMAILGNFEKIAVFFFIPYIIEAVLKLRGKLVKQSFGKPNKDGSLEMPYNKIYGLEHVAILVLKKVKGKAYEEEVVILINIFQILIVLLGLLVFKNSIF
jgi:UDP-N-acetylglucosamine--dolichyl-phosphate N-acetylglucosaminephosphotransferase